MQYIRLKMFISVRGSPLSVYRAYRSLSTYKSFQKFLEMNKWYMVIIIFYSWKVKNKALMRFMSSIYVKYLYKKIMA